MRKYLIMVLGIGCNAASSDLGLHESDGADSAALTVEQLQELSFSPADDFNYEWQDEEEAEQDPLHAIAEMSVEVHGLSQQDTEIEFVHYYNYTDQQSGDRDLICSDLYADTPRAVYLYTDGMPTYTSFYGSNDLDVYRTDLMPNWYDAAEEEEIDEGLAHGYSVCVYEDNRTTCFIWGVCIGEISMLEEYAGAEIKFVVY